MEIPKSYNKVSYDLRPAKQVERRMIIDCFQVISSQFPIRDYRYVGFGSIYFVDFILFHKLIGINKMLSIEADYSIKKRVKFNKPFDPILIEMQYASHVIPKLNDDQVSILWLDYDIRLNRDIIQDVVLACHNLKKGSFLLITVDGRPVDGEPNDWYDYFKNEAENYFDHLWDISTFKKSNLPKINSRILFNAIKQGLVGKDIDFSPLFNFKYKDTTMMVTVGGLLGDKADFAKLQSCDFDNLTFLRQSVWDEPYFIRVPKITRKERFLLDQNMPLNKTWKPKEFELSVDDVEAYNEIYRYYPSYAELLW